MARGRVGDFNRYTRDDILWRDDDGTITDWLSNANGTFSASTTFSTYVLTDWHVVGIGDFNGDGATTSSGATTPAT